MKVNVKLVVLPLVTVIEPGLIEPPALTVDVIVKPVAATIALPVSILSLLPSLLLHAVRHMQILKRNIFLNRAQDML